MYDTAEDLQDSHTEGNWQQLYVERETWPTHSGQPKLQRAKQRYPTTTTTTTTMTLTGQEKVDRNEGLLRQVHGGLVHLHAHLLRKAVTEWKKKNRQQHQREDNTTRRGDTRPGQPLFVEISKACHGLLTGR